MFKFLFLLLLVFFLWPVLTLVLRLFRFKRSVRRAWEGAGQSAGRSDGGGFTAGSRQKVYGSSDGEYVDFEEVTDAEPSRPVNPPAGEDDDFVAESQVVDAEFEEIP